MSDVEQYNNSNEYTISNRNIIVSVYNDRDGASNHNNDSFSITERYQENDIPKNPYQTDIIVNIFRYKFTDEFTSELFKFSKIHQYDHRKDFKEAWKTWIEDNDEIVQEEIRRLQNIGYEGDILDKMFKSARYYFRKKTTEKKHPAERRNYISVQKELLEAMDEHIKTMIHEETYKPSDGFEDFSKNKNHQELIKEEVITLLKNGYNNSDEIKKKMKKTYKNRYFLIVSK